MRLSRMRFLCAFTAALALATPVCGRAAQAVAAPAAPAAQPAPAPTLGLSFRISFVGITIGRMDVNTTFQDDGYRAISNFETSGLATALWEAKIHVTSTGFYSAGLFHPSLYDSFYQRGADKKQQVTLTYDPNGPINVAADPPYKISKYPVTDEQKRATLDPLSAVIYVTAGVSADAGHPCGVTAPVYDGRRRYNIALTYIKDVPVKLDNGLYSGTAHLCQLHYNQIAGYKPAILKEGQGFQPIYGWFADFPSRAAANGHAIVPLKIWTELSWGTLATNLTRLEIDGAVRGRSN